MYSLKTSVDVAGLVCGALEDGVSGCQSHLLRHAQGCAATDFVQLPYEQQQQQHLQLRCDLTILQLPIDAPAVLLTLSVSASMINPVPPGP
jgi:hypothetical protein